jgi:hypothetical protein
MPMHIMANPIQIAAATESGTGFSPAIINVFPRRRIASEETVMTH